MEGPEACQRGRAAIGRGYDRPNQGADGTLAPDPSLPQSTDPPNPDPPNPDPPNPVPPNPDSSNPEPLNTDTPNPDSLNRNFLSTEENIHGGFLHLARQDLSGRLAAQEPTLYDCLLASIYFRKTGDQAQALRLLDIHAESDIFDATYNRIQSLCHHLNFGSARDCAQKALASWAENWTEEQQRYTHDVTNTTTSLSAQGRFPTELRLELLERNRYRNLDSGEHTPCTGIIDRNRRLGRLVHAIHDPASGTWLDGETGLAIGELLQPNHDFRSFFGGVRPWQTGSGITGNAPEEKLEDIAIFLESNPHFGHFLTQSASFANALGYAQHFSPSTESPITVLSRGAVPAWGQSLLQASCPNPLRFVVMNRQQRLAVTQLVVAPQTWIEWHYAHQDHQRLFRQAAWHWLGIKAGGEARSQRRLYFSRSRLRICLRRSVNEEALEAHLSEQGFEVIHPQELPLQQVVALVNEAALIAGPMGSAMHNVLFRLPGPPLATLNFAHYLPGINNAMVEHCSGVDHNFYIRSCEELEQADGEPRALHLNVKRCLAGVQAVLDQLESLS